MEQQLSLWVCWGFALLFMLVATAVRAARLYISLGVLRTSLFRTNTIHFVGAALGYLIGAFVYELTVIVLCAYKDRSKAVPTLLALILVRIFDAFILVVVIFFFTTLSDSRILFFALLLLLALMWGIMFALSPILRRLERNLLELNRVNRKDAWFLRQSYQLRQSLNKLPWEKKGTISMVLSLSVIGWVFEWMAVALVIPVSGDAVAVIINRVGGSFGIALGVNATQVYNCLMLVVYVAAVLLVMLSIVRWLKKDRQACSFRD